MAKRRGTTLVEVLVAIGLVSIVMGILYGLVTFFFSRKSKSSLTTMTERAFAQRDIRIGLQQLMVRMREGTKLLSPEPGFTGDELVFLDVLNRKIRLRRDPTSSFVISEIFENGAWVAEKTPSAVKDEGGRRWNVNIPVRIRNCSNLSFTTMSPTFAVVSVTLKAGHIENALLTAVHLRNANLAPYGVGL